MGWLRSWARRVIAARPCTRLVFLCQLCTISPCNPPRERLACSCRPSHFLYGRLAGFKISVTGIRLCAPTSADVPAKHAHHAAPPGHASVPSIASASIVAPPIPNFRDPGYRATTRVLLPCPGYTARCKHRRAIEGMVAGAPAPGITIEMMMMGTVIILVTLIGTTWRAVRSLW